MATEQRTTAKPRRIAPKIISQKPAPTAAEIAAGRESQNGKPASDPQEAASIAKLEGKIKKVRNND